MKNERDDRVIAPDTGKRQAATDGGGGGRTTLPARRYYRREATRPVMAGPVQIGGRNHVAIQSMCNTRTADTDATLRQIRALATAGCELVRLAVRDETDAEAIEVLTRETDVPLVADIHFDHRLALMAAARGIAKIRINPGNIGSEAKVREVVSACRDRGIPIRIGINSGSLERRLLERYGGPCVEAMMESAKDQTAILEGMGYRDIVLSFKSSEVPLTIEAYRRAAEIFPYPLHLGVTEAGTASYSAVKSSAALGALLHEGIGDTLRISVSDDPLEEIPIAKQLLKAFGLIADTPDLIACPTCGRLQYDMLPYVKEIEAYLQTVNKDLTVAVMGCAVNGPQEASRADIGVAGGKDEALLFSKGRILRKVPQAELVEAVKALIDRYTPGEGFEPPADPS